MRLSSHAHAHLVETAVTKRNGGITIKQEFVNGLALFQSCQSTILPEDRRYIGNRSSGRQGLAIAYQALREGADVTVIAAETVDFELEGATVIRALSAETLLEEL